MSYVQDTGSKLRRGGVVWDAMQVTQVHGQQRAGPRKQRSRKVLGLPFNTSGPPCGMKADRAIIKKRHEPIEVKVDVCTHMYFTHTFSVAPSTDHSTCS